MTTPHPGKNLQDFLEPKILLHDKHRFEIKIDVPLASKEKNSYRVDTFFFIPRPLMVNPTTFRKSEFYSNIQRYIRFKTPQFELGKLADPSAKNSPLVRLNETIHEIQTGRASPATVKRAYDEIKMLGCVTRGFLRDQVGIFLSDLRSAAEIEDTGDPRLKSLRERLKSFLDEIQGFIGQIRRVREGLATPTVPEKLREALSFADEFFSLTVVDSLTDLLPLLREKQRLREGFSEIEPRIAEMIKSQDQYRAAMGYPSVIEKGKDGESLVYRRSVLKKFVSSVLYLQIQTSEWDRWSHIPFAVAAGAAMAFTLLAMHLASQRYGTDSLAFGAAAVAAYMGKDRIKDVLKLWFVNRWTRWFADRTTIILDPGTGETIGKLKEAFSFVPAGSIPPEILRRRVMDNLTSIENDGKPEDVIRYEKEVALYPEKIFKFHERLKDLNDILRVNISPFFAQADDPKVEYSYLNPKSGKLETLQCSRVYHINVLLRYTSRNGSPVESVSYDRIRIVLDRNGIKRLEHVSST